MSYIPSKMYLDRSFISEYEINPGTASIPQSDRINLDDYINQQITAGIILSGAAGTVLSVNTRTGAVVLTSADVGLSNVNNTSDANKPLSIATIAALLGKQDVLVSGTNIKTINGQTLLGSGDITITGGGGAVTSVFTRTGAITSVAGDYTATQITNTPAGNIAAVTVQSAINELDTEKAADSAVVHLAGAESITGVKTFTAQPVGILTTSVAEGTNLYYTNARSIGSTLTGFTSGAGTITAADSILTAIQKLNGNIAASGVSVTDSGSIDFTLTGQNITSIINGITGATVGQVPSKAVGDTISWVTPLSLANVSTSYKYYTLTPTGTNIIPNLTSIPIEPSEVTILINGLKEDSVTVNALGVFTIDNIALGYDINTDDIITVTYFSI